MNVENNSPWNYKWRQWSVVITQWGITMTWSAMCTCTTSLTEDDDVQTLLLCLFGSSFPLSSCCFYSWNRNQIFIPWKQECLRVQFKFDVSSFDIIHRSTRNHDMQTKNKVAQFFPSPRPYRNPKLIVSKGVFFSWEESRNIPPWKVAKQANSDQWFYIQLGPDRTYPCKMFCAT